MRSPPERFPGSTAPAAPRSLATEPESFSLATEPESFSVRITEWPLMNGALGNTPPEGTPRSRTEASYAYSDFHVGTRDNYFISFSLVLERHEIRGLPGLC